MEKTTFDTDTLFATAVQAGWETAGADTLFNPQGSTFILADGAVTGAISVQSGDPVDADTRREINDCLARHGIQAFVDQYLDW